MSGNRVHGGKHQAPKKGKAPAKNVKTGGTAKAGGGVKVAIVETSVPPKTIKTPETVVAPVIPTTAKFDASSLIAGIVKKHSDGE